jgi:hypothetical protein
MSAAPHSSAPSLIRWLIGLVAHGTAAGLLAGVVVLLSSDDPIALLSMQGDVVLAGGLFLYVCAQIGSSTALLIGLCGEGRL